MSQAVILKHDIPDGTSHFDWMIDQPQLNRSHRLLCWRCDCRPDSLEMNEFECIQLPEHRAVYLSYEGAISDDRGVVSRVASGVASALISSDGMIKVRIDWGCGQINYQGLRKESDTSRWSFKVQIL